MMVVRLFILQGNGSILINYKERLASIGFENSSILADVGMKKKSNNVTPNSVSKKWSLKNLKAQQFYEITTYCL